MNAEAFPQRRSAARSRVLMTGMLFTSHGDYPIRIRDISATGARVTLAATSRRAAMRSSRGGQSSLRRGSSGRTGGRRGWNSTGP